MLSIFKSYISRLFFRIKFPASLIHNGVHLNKFSDLKPYSVLFDNVSFINSRLGAYSYVQSASSIFNAEIGKFCSIASEVRIGLANHPIHMVSCSPIFYDNKQPLPKFMTDKQTFSQLIPRTIIESDVWIGHGVIIKAGVTIGIGSIIGAGSVVTKDVPPYTIAAGNPCKKIRTRFKEGIIKRLINSKWWELEDEELKLITPFFTDPELFLQEYKSKAYKL
jgi:acetyltransferase-like isoleucine patch superfamily enzyme